MSRKTISGLALRYGIWRIDKQVKGYGRLCESTGTGERDEAEKYFIHRLEQIRNESVYGVAQVRIWRDAATRYLTEYAHQPSIGLTATYLEQLDRFIGDMNLHHIDDEALQPFIKHKLREGVTNRTVNIALQRVVRIMNLCARKWRDDQKRPWLNSTPMIQMLSEKKSRKPYRMSWEEQAVFFSELPDSLKRMALYNVNTGCREQEVCKLRWEWEIEVPALKTSVFLIPADFGGRHDKSGVKNGEERLVVLNDVAKSVIDGQRGLDKHWVFPYGKPSNDGTPQPVQRMNDSAWRSARTRSATKWLEKNGVPPHSGFAQIRVHDLKHTYGRRLRAADIPFEDRQSLLGHTNGNVTSHYSAAELSKLIDLSNKLSESGSRSPVLAMLKRRAA